MGKQGYVYVDEATINYPKNSAITLAGVALGFKEEYNKKTNLNPQLVLYDFLGIAKRGTIKKREWEILGMMTADRLVQLHKPNHFVTAHVYHTCTQIGNYTLPWLYNHEWRQEPKSDRILRKRIADRMKLTDHRTEAKKYYSMKQSIGRMLVGELSSVKITHALIQDMRRHPNMVIDVQTLEPVKLEVNPSARERN